MKIKDIITGFSKLNKKEKLEIVSKFFKDPMGIIEEFNSFNFKDTHKQKMFDEFSENTISNYHIPYGVVPNLQINGDIYMVPMAIEECSVVAAASNSAKYWLDKGGFHAEVVSMKKIGQVHFTWKGDSGKLQYAMPDLIEKLLEKTEHITVNMQKRGGGILDIELVDMTHEIDDYYQLKAYFDTKDTMGANFINSCLEEFSVTLQEFLSENPLFEGEEKECDILMSILSNYTPECLVRSWVECDIKDLDMIDGTMSGEEFASKFWKAIRIAEIDVHRATTHNKGILNGIDAVAIATGNDFRAIEACAHTYAARNGSYSSLSEVEIKDGRFRYSLTIPMALGTVGGITSLHPLAKRSIELLGNPSADKLMMVAASIGLANNFSAVRALVTKGIQKGHMKMHLSNILNSLEATPEEKEAAYEYFKNHKVSFNGGSKFINSLRNKKKQKSQ